MVKCPKCDTELSVPVKIISNYRLIISLFECSKCNKIIRIVLEK